jgi:hypothetical protein
LAVGEHNDLAGFERDSLAADGGSKASAGRDDVIRNQMTCYREAFVNQGLSG